MDQRPRYWTVLLVLSVALGTAIVAATAVYAIRQILRQDLIDSAEAQTVIRVAKLRAAAERLGGHARGFLLTADPTSFERIRRDRDAFFGRLDRLLQSVDGGTHDHLQKVRTAARQYDEALEKVVGLRRGAAPNEAVTRAFEEAVRPRKDELDEALANLIESEEAQLHSLGRSTERAAARLATWASGIAVGAFVVSLALATLLAQTFQSLRRKQKALQKAMEQVERTNTDLDAFASRIAHDLKTPLTPISLMADRLKSSTDEQVVRTAERIERSAAAANRMLEGLLTFSRLGHRSGGATSAAAPAIRAAVEDFAEGIASGRITIETDLDEEAFVACSEGLFREVVSNLLGNAIKFLAGRDERRVLLVLRARDGNCHFDVRDTGPGIPQEALHQIFAPFYRLPGTRTPGVGLGLAIVRRIVEAHDGTVAVESVVGEGTTFRIVLPCGQPDQTTAAGTPPLPAAVTALHG